MPLETPRPPPELLSLNPARWTLIFGPGAIIASLTIGAGELIFSSRAGALFGSRVLWFFVLALFLKWLLAYSTARHMVLTGRHPFELWNSLPGPRGWLASVFLVLAVAAFPVWVLFHAGTLGTLLAALTDSASKLNGLAHLAWGALPLVLCVGLSLSGGYAALEKIQLLIVVLMLGSVTAVLILIRPDWLALLGGLWPRPFEYPGWVSRYPEIEHHSAWIEAVTCMGILGGSSYDYLAYASYLRDKNWGLAARPASSGALAPPADFDRRWLRAPLVDCTLSFAAVLLFTAVFVACGEALLRPEQKVPSGNNLLTLQAAFVTPLAPALKHLYFAGAFLAIFGTLYGTIEVAPTILRETLRAFGTFQESRLAKHSRLLAILWSGAGALAVMTAVFTYVSATSNPPPNLITILIPANLFTGVLGCGIVCLLAAWTDRKTLSPRWRLPVWIAFGDVAAGMLFAAFGVSAYFEQAGRSTLLLISIPCLAGWLVAKFLTRGRERIISERTQK